jgi:hypothetical protein
MALCNQRSCNGSVAKGMRPLAESEGRFSLGGEGAGSFLCGLETVGSQAEYWQERHEGRLSRTVPKGLGAAMPSPATLLFLSILLLFSPFKIFSILDQSPIALMRPLSYFIHYIPVIWALPWATGVLNSEIKLSIPFLS